MEAGQQLSALSYNNSGKRMTEYRVLNPGNTDPDMEGLQEGWNRLVLSMDF